MASSKARTLANQKNALKSTGPRTARGKARSSANALKHGLSGEGICLPIEDARVVQADIDRLSDELCPMTAEELFKVRRLAVLSLRVDRCYVKEAANLQMAVRNAIPNHDKMIFEGVRALINQLPEDPCASVLRLMQTSQGVDWLVEQWRDLRDSFVASGNLNQIELSRTDQLLGRRYDASGVSPFHELSWKVDSGLERVGGECRTSPEQVDACKARCKLEFEALFSKQIENLLVHRTTLPLADAEKSRQEAPFRAVIDTSNAGQLLRRYETAAAREITKIFAYFNEKKAEEAIQNLAATSVPVEESVELASFGNPLESEPTVLATEPIPGPGPEAEPEVEIAQIATTVAVTRPTPSADGFVHLVERPSRD